MGSPPRTSKTAQGIDYLHHHYREQVTLHSVAEQVALSPNYFSECFRSATGVTFQRYLQVYAAFAKSLLSVSVLPVTEICYAAGVSNFVSF